MLEYEKITKDLNLFKLLSDQQKLMRIEYIQMKENIMNYIFKPIYHLLFLIYIFLCITFHCFIKIRVANEII